MDAGDDDQSHGRDGVAREATVLVQVTDTHLGPPGARPYDTDTAANLRDVARTIVAMELDPAAVLLTGDLSDCGTEASYGHLREIVAAELGPLGCPVLPVVGNHDHRESFRRAYLGEPDATDDVPYRYVHEAPGGVRVVMCDSYLAGAVTGRLGLEQLAWLDARLAESDGSPTIVALHHPSVPRGVPRRNDYLLEDRDAFREVIAGHDVAAVLCGHSHVATTSSFAGTLHVAAPATAYLMDSSSTPGSRPYPGSGFAICTIRDGAAIVNPYLLTAADVAAARARR